MKTTCMWIFFSCLLFLGVRLMSAAEDKPLLKKGDRLVLCGDSITAGDKYPLVMDLFLTVCHPELDVEVIQNAFSGEDTPRFLKERIQPTMEMFKPTFATVVYGMNDGKWGEYKKEIGDAFQTNITEIVKIFQKNNVKVLLGTPGIVGQIVLKETPHYNDQTLRNLRDIMERVAKENGCAFSDSWTAQSDALVKMRKLKGEKFDFAMGDGAHSDWAGQVVIATSMLKALGFGGDVARFEYDAGAKKATASQGHEILKVDPEKTSIEIRSSRYFVDIPYKGSEELADMRKAAEECGFYDKFNRYMFVVKNLPPGKYNVCWETYFPDLKLTSRFNHDFDAEELTRGVNLAREFADSPFTYYGNKIWHQVVSNHTIHWWIQRKTLDQQVKVIQEVVIKPADGNLDANELIKDQEKLRSLMQRNLRAMVVPFDHKLTLTRK